MYREARRLSLLRRRRSLSQVNVLKVVKAPTKPVPNAKRQTPLGTHQSSGIQGDDQTKQEAAQDIDDQGAEWKGGPSSWPKPCLDGKIQTVTGQCTCRTAQGNP